MIASFSYPELTRVARLDTHKDFNRPVFVDSLVVGSRDGYKSLDRAIKELGNVTKGDSQLAVAILKDKGRFFAHRAYEAPNWLIQASNDFTGQHTKATQFALTADTKFKRTGDDVMAFVDGNIVIRPQG